MCWPQAGGIGLETALGLTQAVERINAGGAEPAQFPQADLASLDDVTLLVNNVGAMFEERTEMDGIEATFVVNHLSPYLLTELLLPRLTRVVNVTTGAVGLAKKAAGEWRHRFRGRPRRRRHRPAHCPRRPHAQREARTTRPSSGWNIQID